MTRQIFPHKGEFAVCHMGWARPFIRDGKFESCWVIDTIAPTEEAAKQVLYKLNEADRVRKAMELADRQALERRRNRGAI